MLKTVLSLYMDTPNLPMPTHEEVLVCSDQTTAEEVSLLWRRAIGDVNKFGIYCLVHGERLSYQVCDQVLRELNEYSQGENG